jgi:hypothetical protein
VQLSMELTVQEEERHLQRAAHTPGKRTTGCVAQVPSLAGLNPDLLVPGLRAGRKQDMCRRYSKSHITLLAAGYVAATVSVV